MIVKLVGREYGIEKLNSLLTPGQPDFLAVYGRRRVGKTFLIRQHFERQYSIHFTGTKTGKTEQQLINFCDEYVKRTKNKKLKHPPSSWHEAFSWLAAYLTKLPKKETKARGFYRRNALGRYSKIGFRICVEFFWNRHISGMDNILLIACGSATFVDKKRN